MHRIIDVVGFIEVQENKLLVVSSRDRKTWYLPGGKPEKKENKQETLIREIKEEISVDIIPETIRFYDTIQTQAHAQPEGVIVRMFCYKAKYNGSIIPGREIDEVSFIGYTDKDHTAPAVKRVLENLKNKGQIK